MVKRFVGLVSLTLASCMEATIALNICWIYQDFNDEEIYHPEINKAIYVHRIYMSVLLFFF